MKTKVAFHRNGIGGESFYSMRIKIHGVKKILFAIVPCDAYHKRDASRVYVICPSCSEASYRGDELAPQAFALIDSDGYNPTN
jgi:hypothetical protein